MPRRLLLIGFTVVAVLAPIRPAFACRCAQVTIAGLLEREPDAAIAVVRRTDADGGTEGIGRVERELRGELPDEVPLALDEGASCKPWLDTGQLATLAFEPSEGSWQTLDCGTVDAVEGLGRAFGDLEVDADARGDPAVLLAGPMPGAGLALLDDSLRVLTTAATGRIRVLERCGDAIVTVEDEAEGSVARRRTLPDLAVVSEQPLGAETMQVLDVACADDGTASAVVRGEEFDVPVTYVADLFTDDARALTRAADAAIVADDVLLLESQPDERSSALVVHDVASGQTSTLATFDIAGFELDVAPDGEHLTVRGFGDAPVLLVVETASGRVVARAAGWEMPVQRAWVDDQRLLLLDEGRERDAPPRGAHRIVDVNLREAVPSAALPAFATRTVSAMAGHVVGFGGAELVVRTPDGGLRTSPDPRTAAAADALLLGPVRPDAATAAPTASPTPTVPATEPLVVAVGDAVPGAGIWVAAGGATALVAVGSVWALRRPRA